jgi:NYN domain-containing protein
MLKTPMIQCKGTPRAALFLDPENLLFVERDAGNLAPGLEAIDRMLVCLERRATVVAKVAVCDSSLAAALAVPLGLLGVRTFPHHGGENAADVALLERIECDLPSSCDLVVLGSGDHIFVPIARRLRAAGKRVEVVARAGAVAASLYRAADDYADLRWFATNAAA